MMNKNIKMATVNGKASVEELKGLLTMARIQGLKRIILRIPVRLLAIDTRYQTEIRTSRKLGYLTNYWDERKLMPLIIVPHDEEGVFVIVDGYGRTKASQIINAEKYEYLECLVLLDAPEDPDKRLLFEAELFIGQMDRVPKLKSVQKHGGRQCVKDPSVMIMDELKEIYKFEYVYTQGQRQSGVLGSYDETYYIAKTRGKECLRYIFEIAKNSAFNRKKDGYSTYMMRALKDAWIYYPDNREETLDFLSKYLRKFDPVKFKADAVSKYKLLDMKAAVSLHMEDLIVENFNLNHARETDGFKVKLVKAA